VDYGSIIDHLPSNQAYLLTSHALKVDEFDPPPIELVYRDQRTHLSCRITVKQGDEPKGAVRFSYHKLIALDGMTSYLTHVLGSSGISQVISTIQRRKLGLNGHVARMSDSTAANQITTSCCLAKDGVRPCVEWRH